MSETNRVKCGATTVGVDATTMEITITGPKNSTTAYVPLFINLTGVSRKQLLLEIAACLKKLAEQVQS